MRKVRAHVLVARPPDHELATGPGPAPRDRPLPGEGQVDGDLCDQRVQVCQFRLAYCTRLDEFGQQLLQVKAPASVTGRAGAPGHGVGSTSGGGCGIACPRPSPPFTHGPPFVFRDLQCTHARFGPRRRVDVDRHGALRGLDGLVKAERQPTPGAVDGCDGAAACRGADVQHLAGPDLPIDCVGSSRSRSRTPAAGSRWRRSRPDVRGTCARDDQRSIAASVRVTTPAKSGVQRRTMTRSCSRSM